MSANDLTFDDFSDDLLSGSTVTDKMEDEIDISETKSNTRFMQLQQVMVQLEYRLSGGMWKSNGEKMHFVGSCLAGEDAIQKIILIVASYSREIMLMMDINRYDWAEQMFKTMSEVVSVLTKTKDSSMEHASEIFRAVYDTMKNIGNLVCNSNFQDMMKPQFGISNDKPDSDFKFQPVNNIPMRGNNNGTNQMV